MTAIERIDDARLLDGVRRKRMLAFLIDFTIVCLLSFAVGVLVFFLGIVTLGLAWLLYGGIFPIVAVLYSGMTISDERQATLGMRATGLTFRLDNGARPSFVYGAVHVILFYVTVTFLTPLVLVVSLLNSRKRALHDILVGATIENEI